MRICIDARWVFEKISGIGLYTQELIRALAAIDTRNDYLLLFESESIARRTIPNPPPRFKIMIPGCGIFSPRSQWAIPSLLRRERIEVYHSTNYMMPLLSGGGAKRIVTIHDLIPLMFRDHAPKAKKAKFFPLYKGLMHLVARRADRIISVSESTKSDIIRELRASPEKITVTHEGVTPAHVPINHQPSTIPQILFVGRRDPYKNLPLLIEAVSHLTSHISILRLRVVGPPDDRYPAAEETAARLKLNAHIDWVGYASPDQLIDEYRHASVFVLPSKYEGFGLTVLEAMACGAPVVCSQVSSLPEVVGDAGLLVPPDDALALAEAIRRVLTDNALATDLRRRGIERARPFTWERCARETLAVYEAVLSGQ